MTTPTDTDLLDSLRDANPVDADQLLTASLARIRARVFEDIPEADRLTDQPSVVWRRQLLAVGGAIAVVVLVAILGRGGLAPGVAPSSSGNGDLASRSPDNAVVAPGSSDNAGNASCAYVYSLERLKSLERLTDREWAFDGTVAEIAGQQVTFHVNEWFRGSGNSSSTFTGDGSWEDGPTLSVGQRYLVAGADRFVWGCGFTQPYDPAIAAAWRDALGR